MQRKTEKKKAVKNKEVLVDKILFLETNSEYYSFFQNMYLTLERFCKNILYFNRRDNYFKYGKEKMNEMLLDLIKKEKPDYVFTWLTWDEFYVDTLLKINKISPKTKTVVIFGDDTIQFYDFSRYYALLFNYVFTTLKSYQQKYKEEGVRNVFFTSLTDAEYAPDYDNYFTEGKDIVFFRNKEELLEKVNYFLKKEKERENFAEEAYKKVRKEYALHEELKSFILKTRKDTPVLKLPPTKKTVFRIGKKEIDLGTENLKKLIEKYDYVSFQTNYSEHLKYKDFFQMYSLEKSKKPISCCNYYVFTKSLGDYLLFFTRDGRTLLNKEEFNSLLDINQLMVTKEYFLNNYETLRESFHGKKIDFVNLETTSFVAMPLVRISILKTKDYDILKKAFGLKYLYRLYSLLHQKKIFSAIFASFLIA